MYVCIEFVLGLGIGKSLVGKNANPRIWCFVEMSVMYVVANFLGALDSLSMYLEPWVWFFQVLDALYVESSKYMVLWRIVHLTRSNKYCSLIMLHFCLLDAEEMYDCT